MAVDFSNKLDCYTILVLGAILGAWESYQAKRSHDSLTNLEYWLTEYEQIIFKKEIVNE